MKGDDTVSGLKSCNILGFATILCDKFILAGEFLKRMIMKDDLSLHSSGTILLFSNTTAFHTALQVFRAKAGANNIKCEVCHSCKLQENVFTRPSLLMGCIRK